MAVTPLDRELVAAKDARGSSASTGLTSSPAWSVWRAGISPREAHEAGVLPTICSASSRPSQSTMQSNRPSQPIADLASCCRCWRPSPTQAIEGQLVHYGPADELGDSFLAVIETGGESFAMRASRGKPTWLTLDGVVPGSHRYAGAERAGAEAGGRRHCRHRGADRRALFGGASPWRAEPRQPQASIEANIRRLEAMRRMSLISTHADGVFVVGHDHLKRATLFDERLSRRYPLIAECCVLLDPGRADQPPSAPPGSTAYWRAKSPRLWGRAPSPASTLRLCSSAGCS